MHIFSIIVYNSVVSYQCIICKYNNVLFLWLDYLDGKKKFSLEDVLNTIGNGNSSDIEQLGEEDDEGSDEDRIADEEDEIETH